MGSANDDGPAMELDYRDEPAMDAVAQRNRALLADAIDQIVAGNFDGFWAIFDRDVVFHEAACLPYGGTHRGIEATRKAFGEMAASFSRMDTTAEALMASRDLCILYSAISFRTARTGVEAGFPVCEVFRFRDGKVIEWRACYFDACLMAAALDGAPC